MYIMLITILFSFIITYIIIQYYLYNKFKNENIYMCSFYYSELEYEKYYKSLNLKLNCAKINGKLIKYTMRIDNNDEYQYNLPKDKFVGRGKLFKITSWDELCLK